ncbi:carboxypeptidase-like regulatory domain-containing protein [Phormidium tenue]|uniref:Carboxypeptidase regulatory-like domain-containing protein n=1 Tax=Phormidium tenue NIES-30 TaxID=549789 RepID=A0A1U7J7D0_9CYAN|nr:carboxypeptidase-like regulatory domain-containing protein [Phormidium tenue]MBD2231553.1 carboxypeptidase regulatory-like domain-containing protein [Phormidium tenue FACHB-1052]OKH49064.1 hypothetical protein NIES30_07790 [Phormidium tenue NIES-30]
MSGSQTANQSLPNAARPYRVAIAGTITNAATGDIMPQAVVRITAAPVAFIEEILAFLVAAIAHQPEVQANYSHMVEDWQRSLAPLAPAQRLLDCLESPLALARPDQTQSGGDGHYCFYDLPPGSYTLTATYILPHRGQGVTSAQVEVLHSDRRLSFAAADLAISLVPGACPLPVVGDCLPSPLVGPEQAWHTPAAACPRAETLSR